MSDRPNRQHQRFSVCLVPNADSLVPVDREDKAPVWTYVGGFDNAEMLKRRAYRFSGFGIPHTAVNFSTRSHNTAAIRREHTTTDTIAMHQGRNERLLRSRVPDLCGLIPACCHKAVSLGTEAQPTDPMMVLHCRRQELLPRQIPESHAGIIVARSRKSL